MRDANIELIRKFLAETEPEFYDMKKQWIDIEDPLERELYFKRPDCRNIPDPDCCDLTMSIMCVLLRAKGFRVTGYLGRYIELEDFGIFETDTANSFISLYKGALLTYLPSYRQMLDKYGINGSFMNEYEKIYAHRDEISLKVCGNQELYDVFSEFSALTHTIGNFVLGPFGFNCADERSKAKLYSAKKWADFDRMDLFLKKVAEGCTYQSWEEWYSRYLEKTYTNFFYKSVVKKKEDIFDLSRSEVIDLGNEDLCERVKVINQIIRERGKAMVNDLKNIVAAVYEE